MANKKATDRMKIWLTEAQVETLKNALRRAYVSAKTEAEISSDWDKNVEALSYNQMMKDLMIQTS